MIQKDAGGRDRGSRPRLRAPCHNGDFTVRLPFNVGVLASMPFLASGSHGQLSGRCLEVVRQSARGPAPNPDGPRLRRAGYNSNSASDEGEPTRRAGAERLCLIRWRARQPPTAGWQWRELAGHAGSPRSWSRGRHGSSLSYHMVGSLLWLRLQHPGTISILRWKYGS